MSYTIEFDRQFIRSTMGITPCWLSGDNNVTTGSGRGEKVARSWSIFYSLLGVSKDDMLAKVEPSLGRYQQHWKKGGKWVDDKGLTTWIEKGCKLAATVEEIIEANHFAAIHCFVMDYSCGYPATQAMAVWISNTVDFDDWLYRVKHAIADAPAGTLYPCIHFSFGMPIRHPRKEKKSNDEEVLIKKGRTYLVKMSPNGTESSWTYQKQNAAVLSYADAEALRNGNISHLRDTKFVSARVLDNPDGFIIKGEESSGDVFYVQRLAKSRFCYIRDTRGAKRYSSASAAKRAMARVQEICDHNKKAVTMSVISGKDV